MLSRSPDPSPPSMDKLIHNLNNAMTGVLAMSDLCLRDTPKDHPHYELLKIINESAEKSRVLINQITALHQKNTTNSLPPASS